MKREALKQYKDPWLLAEEEEQTRIEFRTQKVQYETLKVGSRLEQSLSKRQMPLFIEETRLEPRRPDPHGHP